MYTVRVDSPDPRFGSMLLEQFGGANGELAAAMQYYVQGLNADDPDRKDMLIDIGVEELSHLEVIGTLCKLHLKPTKDDFKLARADPLTAVAGGGGVNLFNSQGNPWTADYLKVTGELDVDLRSDIAAEVRAKIVYERLINLCDDRGAKDALRFLMTREITDVKVVLTALGSPGKDALSVGKIPPSKDVVNTRTSGRHSEPGRACACSSPCSWCSVSRPSGSPTRPPRESSRGSWAAAPDRPDGARLEPPERHVQVGECWWNRISPCSPAWRRGRTFCSTGSTTSCS